MAHPAPGEDDALVWNQLDELAPGRGAVRHLDEEESARVRLQVGLGALPSRPLGRSGQKLIDGLGRRVDSTGNDDRGTHS
jgi:hypothetical protein